MANHNEGLALDLDLFDETKSGYVPEHRQKKKIEAPKLITPKTVSPEIEKSDAAASRKASAIAALVALIFLLTLGSIVYSGVCLADRKYELNELKNELEAVQSENVILQVQFNSLMSKDKVEDYAITKLGMVKKESYQISYFDMTGEDTAVSEAAVEKSEN